MKKPLSLLIATALAGCGGSATNPALSTFTPEALPRPTATPQPAPNPQPTATPTSGPQPGGGNGGGTKPSPSASPSPTPSASPSPTPSASPTPPNGSGQPPARELVPAPATSFVANVRDYGARGDGQSDDTDAIQKAIDAVNAKGGGIVDVPAGTYLIDPMRRASSYYETSCLILKSNVILLMTDRTVLKALPHGSQFASVIAISDATNAHLLGGTIEGERDRHSDEYGEWAHGVRINNSSNVVIEKLTSRNHWGDGFYIGKRATSKLATENITFHRVNAEHNRRQGLSITYGKDIRVLNSLFRDTDGTDPRAGIDIEPNKDEQVSNVEMRGNTFIGNRIGMVASNHMHGGSTSVKNVIFEDNIVRGNHAGILFVGIEGGRARHNTLYQRHDMPKNYPYHYQYGIELRNGAFQKVSGIDVSHNTLYGGNVIDRNTSGNSFGTNAFKSDVYVFGVAQPGQKLTAEVYDGDYGELRRHVSIEVPPRFISSYQWLADGVAIPGATASSYTLTENERGKKITVQIGYTDKAGQKESATSEPTLPVGYQNHAPTDIRVNPLVIYGNEDQPEVGIIQTTDADADDVHRYTIDDERFEINGDFLKMKPGQRLDYSKVNSLKFTITATDQLGASFSKTFTAYVRAPRGAPEIGFNDFTIDNRTVRENQPGAVIGRLSLNDKDIGKTHKYYVVDRRFELVNGLTLKLKAGQQLDYETEPLARVHIIASNSGGRTIMKEFVLQVLDDPNEPTTASNAIVAGQPGQPTGTAKTAGPVAPTPAPAAPDSATGPANTSATGSTTGRNGQNSSATAGGNDAAADPALATPTPASARPDAAGPAARVDLSQHFQTPDELRALVDRVKAEGGTALQLRLSSDDGYVLESEALGQTLATARRRTDGTYENSLGRPFYGREQLAALADYARRQHVELIAEVDFPGAAGGIYQLLKQKDPARAERLFRGNGSTAQVAEAGEFVREIYSEVLQALPGSRHFHLGGAEFTGQRETSASFLDFVSANGRFLQSRGVQPRLWNDGVYSEALPHLDKTIEIEWRRSGDGRASGEALRSAGFRVRDSQ